MSGRPLALHGFKDLALTLAAASAFAAGAYGQAQRLPDNTRQQISALLAEKASRNAAQVKMDSHLVHAAQILRGLPVSPDFPTPPGELEAVHRDANDVVEVDIRSQVTPGLLAAIRAAGGTVVNAFPRYQAARARLPLLNVERIAGRDDVRQIRLAAGAQVNGAGVPGSGSALRARGAAVRAQLASFFAGRKSGDLPAPVLGSLLRKIGAAFFTSTEGPDTYGDTAHMGPTARSTFSLDGTGVKIGLLSDGVNSLKSEQGNGNLPSNVTVITVGGQSQAGSGDEGTAMLEIVYTLAPGAQLFFATGNGGEAQMAANIQGLQAAGCNIIVDDITYFNEGPFQDDIVSQAVNSVTAQGAFYFSAAGNNGNLLNNQSGTWQGNFVSGGSVTLGSVTGLAHSFGADNYDELTTASSVEVIGGSSGNGAYELMWSDPLNRSNNDYDLFITDAAGDVQGSSTNVQNGTGDPEENITGSGKVASACAAGTCRIVVVATNGAAVRTLFLSTERGLLSVATNGATYGHAAAANAFGVAATDARYAVPTLFPNCNGFSLACNEGAENGNPSRLAVETFSSDGPRQMFYNANGTPINSSVVIPGGTVLSKPDLTENVAQHDVMMLGLARLLDDVTLPGAVEIRMGIFPPPHLVACVVTPRHQIEIAVAIDVEENPTGLDVERAGIDDALLPALRSVLHPDCRVDSPAVGDQEIDTAILIDVAHDAGGLLIGSKGNRQIMVSTRQMLPGRVGESVDARVHDCALRRAPREANPICCRSRAQQSQ